MKATTLARWERTFRPLLTKLPSKFVVAQYSRGHFGFIAKLKKDIPLQAYAPPSGLAKTLWGIPFRSPLMNAAGMFKNGDCYAMCALQGAGAYLGGTGTWNKRAGNKKNGIYLPFAPYPGSHSAGNWLGLPNDGDEVNAPRARNIQRAEGTPVGWSVMGSPDFQGEERLRRLTESMKLYERAGVDFLEMNESCPNTEVGKPQEDGLAERLRYVKKYFLDQRNKRIPVIVKFSNDTDISQVPPLLDLLFELGFDGVNFGNTSTAYSQAREHIAPDERRLFDYYTQTFGGGVSGRPLKERSLALASRAVEYIKSGPPAHEFHVMRTGGIESWTDIEESERAGISLNQWYTGYFEQFAQYGHGVYREFFEPKAIKKYAP